MAARKLQQEVDKCFKKVDEGVAEFESIYEKIEQSTNQPQKEKLEDNLKREIKKLQRLRDQIKTWAASNDIKDKAPLLEKRKLIETQMERFKAVEKAMKTKAYSKEGLSAAAKLDPKEQAKHEASEFLSAMVDELEQQLESLEAENESIQVTMKKGKNQGAKADRMAAIEGIIERHKWHQGKLELVRRSLENGGVEPEQVTEIEENIRYYVTEGLNDDYVDDDELYDELNLETDEEVFGMPHDNDRSSSQDNQSVHEDSIEPERASSIPAKAKPATESSSAVTRKPSTQPQVKSPLPQLAQLSSTPASSLGTANGGASTGMKPATLPARPVGETLKYASAAAAAADKNNVGIAPLPPPPGSQTAPSSTGISPLPVLSQGKASAVNSPALAPALPVPQEIRQPTPAESKAVEPKAVSPPPPAPSSRKEKGKKAAAAAAAAESSSKTASQTNGNGNGAHVAEEEDEEPIYYLPSSLSDLLESYEVTKNRPLPVNSRSQLRMLAASQQNVNGIDNYDTEPPRTYKPEVRVPSSGYPQEPLQIFDDPRLYSRIEPDTLFYVFYYKQGTSQQYLAAKALKDQSWRFHKQYQTWFQRHEEPKNITEEFEQGTYRFFDYESTWMNRRKADFKFAYRFLEDDV